MLYMIPCKILKNLQDATQNFDINIIFSGMTSDKITKSSIPWPFTPFEGTSN